MELALIGPWRFAGKVPSYLLRNFRNWQARKPKSWSNTLLCDDPFPSFLAGKWFYGSSADIDYPELGAMRDGLLQKAERYAEQIFYVNGREVHLADPPCNGRWDVDPITGLRWPQTSPYEPMGDGAGDVRFPWELDRIQHILVFGQAWRYTKDPRWPQSIIDHIERLMNEAPYERGIHWRDGLQLAVRIFSLAGAADLCHDVPGNFHGIINNAVLGHALSLRRQISPHSSATNNHSIGEACGLIIAGLFLNRHSVAAAFLRGGLRRLEVELKRQLYADGTPYEGSVPYIRFELDFLLLSILALKGMNCDVPGWFIRASHDVTASLSAMADSRGRIPPIGDGDDARVVRLDDEPYLAVNETLHLAERTLKTVDLAPADTSFGFALWAGGPPDQKQHYSRMSGDITAHLPDSGLIHIRRGVLDVWLDCGPTGLGPFGFGGHGHNDTTAIVVHLNGKGLLHDPGWYTYQGDTALRNRLRGTSAHNTISIDGAEQARLGGLYEIIDDCKPTPVRIRYFDREGVAIVCGHTGFDRLGKNVCYRRFIIVNGTGPWIIQVADVVRSSSEIEVQGHVGSDFEIEREGDGRMYLGGAHILEFRGMEKDLQVERIPYSKETGVLLTGFGINWAVGRKNHIKEMCKRKWCYISRWRLTVNGE